jgi:hypothetical protein
MPESILIGRGRGRHGIAPASSLLWPSLPESSSAVGARCRINYYVDVLWFGSLGYGDVFWKTLSLQWGIFTGHNAAD